MKRKGYALLAALITSQMLLSGAATVSVSADGSIGEAYTAPDSPAVTYNMNLDWKFYDTKATNSVQDSITNTIKDGKKFYEKDYDDSAWETVSIPHGIGGGTNSFTNANTDAGGGYRSVLLYRKTFTVPASAKGGKVFFELEGIRQCAYVWVNGEKVGYYEAGIAAMGFDLTNFVTPGEEAVIAILNDGATARGTSGRIPYETIPGDEWGSSYTPDNYKHTSKDVVGAQYQWNTKDFNEPQIGLVYDAYLHVKGDVYQTLPLYNNLKTTGNYIYADNFDIRSKTATIHVDAEVRNGSANDGDYTLEVAVVDMDGNLKYDFESDAVTVAKAADAGVTYETAVESDVYDAENVANPVGLTKVNTPDVTHITASFDASDMRFWSTDDPYLYTVYTILKDGDGNVVDVQKKDTGFRKITFDKNSGILINDKSVWMPGYAQRSTNEWAVLGISPDWLEDYDMALLKENNSNFIRWMHVAPKPFEVRSSDRYGVAVVVPAGDKEGTAPSNRQWSQRTEAMRDVMIYFRNSPSVVFYETGNSAVGSKEKADEMAALRDTIDPYGMRFIGARSTQSASEINYDYNYAGTMYGNYGTNAVNAMNSNGKPGPIMETEYARDEAPRRVWDLYSPPDFDYVNKYLSAGGKLDGYDVWNLTQEEASVRNVREYYGYYANRNGYGDSIYSAAAMMVWSDSNMHTRNTATENCRTTGRVDPVRQTKEMFEATKAAQSPTSDIHIIGHWSYPELTDDTYNYYGTNQVAIDGSHSYEAYDMTKKLKRDPLHKTVYVIGSADISKIELYRKDGSEETLLGTDSAAEANFIYQFDNIDVTKGDGVIAKAYDARGTEVATDEIARTYDAVSLRLTPHTAVKEDADGNTVTDWRADGADIAYFDVEVVDKNGNVCALNYDKINFTYSGNGTYLGGYNSGSGAGCFQNSSDTNGLSFYFGGAKDGVSTIGKDYVYAENGTNRIFVRSTREAGSFTLNAAMDGMLPVSATITSEPVDVVGGLTTEMPSVLKPGAKAAPVTSNVAPMKPLMLSKLLISWANVKTVTEQDDTDYYDVYIGETKLELGARAFKGTMDNMYGPAFEILTAAKDAGITSFSAEIVDDNGVNTLVISSPNGHTYHYPENSNQYYIDGNKSDTNECVDATVIRDGVLIANLTQTLDWAGLNVTLDDTAKTLTISINN